MIGSQDFFLRHEIKYSITAGQRDDLLRALKPRLIADPHGESVVCSVYYDTPDYRLIRRSMEKPTYKEKLRIRSYGPAGPEDMVYIEIKKKYRDIVSKRRLSLSEREAEAYLSGKAKLSSATQIGDEIEYFRSCYPGIVPSVYICCDRMAFYSAVDPNLRLTFDQNIRWRNRELSLQGEAYGSPLLNDDQVLMEIKALSSLPIWLTNLLSEKKIYHNSFSKYGTAYCAMQENKQKGGCFTCLTSSSPVSSKAARLPA